MGKTVLIIAAHCDDEVLGCGGTMLRHIAAGDIVSVIFMADGESSRSNSNQDDVDQRMKASMLAHQIIGVKQAYFLGFPDNQMDSVPLLNIVKKLEEIIDEILPDVVYTHHYGDLNIDHQITHQAVLTACRPLSNLSVSEIFGFEVVSSTEWGVGQYIPFIPNLFVDISEYLESKLGALEAYASEMRSPPHSRSKEHIVSLAKHRGYTAGVSAAEAFSVIRVVR